MDYDQLNVAKIYNQARALLPETSEQWKNLMLKYVPKGSVHTILDLGCGTGRFSGWLQELYDVKVVGVDPGKTMLAEAKEYVKNPNVTFLDGSAEHIPLENNSVDLVFMSMMYHAIESLPEAFVEIKRVLKPGGLVVMRQATIETNNMTEVLKFFPEATEFANQLVVSREEIKQKFIDNGFALTAYENVKQVMAHDHKEYLEKMRLKAYSIFRKISDEVFDKRFAEYEEFSLRPENINQPGYEYRELFIFQKTN